MRIIATSGRIYGGAVRYGRANFARRASFTELAIKSSIVRIRKRLGRAVHEPHRT